MLRKIGFAVVGAAFVALMAAGTASAASPDGGEYPSHIIPIRASIGAIGAIDDIGAIHIDGVRIH